MKREAKPRQILFSKRANVFYLEHVRVMQKDGRIVYLQDVPGDPGLQNVFNLPERNTSFLLLGKGSSITDAAVRRLAESNVSIGFVGSGGSPAFAAMDAVFLTTQSEYRPTEFMQAWMRLWLDDGMRLRAAKVFFARRLAWALLAWRQYPALSELSADIATRMGAFQARADTAPDTASLMAVEGEWVKQLYQIVGRALLGANFRRDEEAGGGGMVATANIFLNHGNYLAYGYAASALHVLGISFALPVMHGKTRRGALVFDVADLCKDALIVPCAFESAAKSHREQQFREQLIDRCIDAHVLDGMIETIEEVAGVRLQSDQ